MQGNRCELAKCIEGFLISAFDMTEGDDTESLSDYLPKIKEALSRDIDTLKLCPLQFARSGNNIEFTFTARDSAFNEYHNRQADIVLQVIDRMPAFTAHRVGGRSTIVVKDLRHASTTISNAEYNDIEIVRNGEGSISRIQQTGNDRTTSSLIVTKSGLENLYHILKQEFEH